MPVRYYSFEYVFSHLHIWLGQIAYITTQIKEKSKQERETNLSLSTIGGFAQ